MTARAASRALALKKRPNGWSDGAANGKRASTGWASTLDNLEAVVKSMRS
jgi:hypothetical protein